uniref:Uncharacterized protein n=1 Tax=Rhizophora mucronata TaxID=61149 RepID=A0A2P2LG68_RHIMU
MDCDKKHSTCIWTIRRAHDRCLPMEHVFSNRACAARGRRILLEILELFQDSLRCHPLPINHQKSPERDPPFYLFLDSLRLRGGRE